jgi:hypothetical protein
MSGLHLQNARNFAFNSVRAGIRSRLRFHAFFDGSQSQGPASRANFASVSDDPRPHGTERDTFGLATDRIIYELSVFF